MANSNPPLNSELNSELEQLVEIALFYRKTCPYSSKVREFIRDHGLLDEVEERDIENDPETLEELIEVTETDQVPCLVVDGKPILESDAIVDWLDEYGKGRPPSGLEPPSDLAAPS